jgi:hypothetical protein
MTPELIAGTIAFVVVFWAVVYLCGGFGLGRGDDHVAVRPESVPGPGVRRDV